LLTVKESRVPSHCRKEGLHINIAVGDGANDLPMLNLAGLGIAFHNNSERKCFLVDFQSWSGWGLYLLGYHDRHIDMMETTINRVKTRFQTVLISQ
jgi:phosphoserine phosphatase